MFSRISLTVVTCLLFISTAIAQVLPANPDVGKLLTELLTNPLGLGKLGLAMSLIVLFVQLLNWNIFDKWMKTKKLAALKLGIILLLGQAYTVIFLVQNGAPLVQSIVGVITSGGAIAFYSILKPFFASKK